MRSIILCGFIAALAAPALAQQPASDTLQQVIAKGQTMTGDMQGMAITFTTTYSADGAYKTVMSAPERTMTGKWRIDGDKLCTTGDGNPTTDCMAYPAGKKSGDTFDVTHPRLGPAKVTIN